MSCYGVFIISAYLAVFMILGGLTVASLRARNKTRHALAERGLERRR
jgi:heme exporter protein CcmD